MKEQVTEFITQLVAMDLSRGEVNAKAYNYALALLDEHEAEGGPITSAMMRRAGALVKIAWESIPPVHQFSETKRGSADSARIRTAATQHRATSTRARKKP